jgi:hypothetical protein
MFFNNIFSWENNTKEKNDARSSLHVFILKWRLDLTHNAHLKIFKWNKKTFRKRDEKIKENPNLKKWKLCKEVGREI